MYCDTSLMDDNSDFATMSDLDNNEDCKSTKGRRCVKPKSDTDKSSEEKAIIADRMSHKGGKLRKYSIEDKLQAIEMAKVKGNRPTARILGIADKRIREWRLKEDELRSMPAKRSRLNGGGRPVFNDTLEKQLAKFAAETSAQNIRLTYQMLGDEASRIWSTIKDTYDDMDFKASRSFLDRFVKKNNIFVVPGEESRSRISRYVDSVRNLIRKHEYCEDNMIAAFEAVIWLDPKHAIQVDSGGSHLDEAQCSVLLCTRMNGCKLKPIVTVKNTNISSEIFPEVIIAKDDVMSSTVVVNYFHTALDVDLRHLLIWESCQNHSNKEIKQYLRKLNIDTVLVPSECREYFHSFNKRCKQQFVSNLQSSTENPSSISKLIKIIHDSWYAISKEEIRESFADCQLFGLFGKCSEDSEDADLGMLFGFNELQSEEQSDFSMMCKVIIEEMDSFDKISDS